MREIRTTTEPSVIPSAAQSSPADLSLADLDDADLLAFARRGHDGAYAALFTRHSYAAHRLARHLGAREEADDIVSESFAQVLDLLRRGKGPDRAFRAYLFTTIRHEAGRRAKARQRVMPTDDDHRIDSVVPFGGGDMEEFERSAIRSAYESLPERWRTVLWHLDVEGRKPQELGPLLDLSPNGVSALAYRARSGLREAYLQQHVSHSQPVTSQECHEVRAKLSAYVRRTSPVRDRDQVRSHLTSCRECTAIHADLQEVNREVGSVTVTGAVGVSLATGGVAGGWAWLSAHVATAAKAVLTAITPPATVAAVTAATVMGVTASEVVDPPRRPMTSQVEVPHANRPRVASVPAQQVSSAEPSQAAPSSPKAQPSSGGSASKPATAPTPATGADHGSATPPEPVPAPQPSASITLGPVVSVQADSSGIDARIAGVTVKVPSRLVRSMLSQGTTN